MVHQVDQEGREESSALSLLLARQDDQSQIVERQAPQLAIHQPYFIQTHKKRFEQTCYSAEP